MIPATDDGTVRGASWYGRGEKGMKRFWGICLTAVFGLGLSMMAAAEPTADGITALLTEPGALPTGVEYAQGDTSLNPESIPWVEGCSGQAVRLESTSLLLEEVVLPPEFSLSLWVRWEPTDADGEREPTLLQLEGTPGFTLAASGTDGVYRHSPLMRLTDAAGETRVLSAEGSDGLTDGQWHRLTITGDAQVTRLYLDGVPVNEAEVSVWTDGSRRLYFGGRTEETGVTALVDEVYLYDRVLTMAELAGSADAVGEEAPAAVPEKLTAPDPLQPQNRLWILAFPGGAVVLLLAGALWKPYSRRKR